VPPCSRQSIKSDKELKKCIADDENQIRCRERSSKYSCIISSTNFSYFLKERDVGGTSVNFVQRLRSSHCMIDDSEGWPKTEYRNTCNLGYMLHHVD